MKQQGRRLGVIVGISDYSHVGANNLRFTGNDAARLYDILHSKAGFNKTDLHLLCDAPPEHLNSVAKPPTRSDILSAVNSVCSRAEADDLILLFFAGHGCELGGKPYLLTNDTRLDVVRDTAIEVDAINEYLHKSKAKCILRAFDACRSGFSAARLLPMSMSRGLEAAFLHTASGWSTFSACSTGESAYEHPDFKQGIFSFYLCEGLNGNAANEEGIVTWDRLIDYVKYSVGNFCKQQSYLQTPHSVADLSGSLELVQQRIEHSTGKATLDTNASPVDILHAEFRGILDQHTATLPAHVRDFKPTRKDDLAIFERCVTDSITRQLHGFAHPVVSINFESKGNLPSYDNGTYNEMLRSINSAKVQPEFKGEALAIEVTFVSSQLVIPSSKLIFVVVRFNFFYWLWCKHICSVTKAHTNWEPGPPMAHSYFTFKPLAIAEPLKIQPVVQQVLRESFQRIAGWCDQSKKHFTDRVQLLNTENLIE